MFSYMAQLGEVICIRLMSLTGEIALGESEICAIPKVFADVGTNSQFKTNYYGRTDYIGLETPVVKRNQKSFFLEYKEENQSWRYKPRSHQFIYIYLYPWNHPRIEYRYLRV